MHPQRKSVASLFCHISGWHHHRIYPYSHARASGSSTLYTKSHLFPHHFKHSLISVGHLCDHDVKWYYPHPVSLSLKGEHLYLWGGGTTPRASGEYNYQFNPLAHCQAKTQLTMSANSDPLRTPLHTSMQSVSAPSKTLG
jgi:hypothetical protein